MTFRKTISVLIAGLVIVSASASMAASRIALVIGNGAYKHTAALKNPRNDARAIAATLEKLGFSVSLGLDLDKDALEDMLFQFGGKAQASDVAVAYYAGHAVEVGGVNYILPIDATLKSERHLRHETISVGAVLDELQGAKRLKIVMLDACRDNPLAAQMALSMGTRSASVGRGLKAVTRTESDTLIAYATKDGAVAEDGHGKHSPFAAAILKHITEPGLEVRRLFGKVRDTVRAETRGRQEPYVYQSLGGDGFYFKPGASGGSASQSNVEIVLWESVKDSRNVGMFRAYLQRYPNGVFAEVARLKIGEHTPVQTARAYAPTRDEVREVQRLLTALGYDTRGVDGRYGPGTERAVDRFRRVQGVSGGGIDADLLTTLRKAYIARRTATVRPSPTRHSREGGSPSRTRSLKPGDKFRDCENALVASAGSYPSGVFCGPEMVVVPAGSFMMGSNDGFDQKPVHRVTIPQPFAVGIYEVTQAEWRAVMGANPSRFKGGRNPVENVSWDDAKAYLKRLSARTDNEYRLLSESEWEYAARAGSRTKYPWGNGIDSSKAKYGSQDGTRPVGSYNANAFGLYDTVGNVWEWTEDCSNESYNGAPSNGDAWTTFDCRIRVLRGGSWSLKPRHVRSAIRSRGSSGFRYELIGFRVARPLPRTN